MKKAPAHKKRSFRKLTAIGMMAEYLLIVLSPLMHFAMYSKTIAHAVREPASQPMQLRNPAAFRQQASRIIPHYVWVLFGFFCARMAPEEHNFYSVKEKLWLLHVSQTRISRGIPALVATIKKMDVFMPVAPSCNIKCNYCTRRHECANESRPGVTSRI